MKIQKYIPRTIDGLIERKLHSSGAIHITGPKGCGKSTTGSQFCKTEMRLQDPENADKLIDARIKPSKILTGDAPVMIDEWQVVPSLWDSVRAEVDKRNEMGQFILTGSSIPADDGYYHSGVGRITEIRMRTMSLFESMDSTGTVSINDLFNGKNDFVGKSTHTLKDIAYLIVRGGWPRSLNIGREYASDITENYYNATIGIDIFRVDGKKKNTEVIDKLMRSYARNISTMASTKTLIKDVLSDATTASQSIIEDYIDAIKRLYIIEDEPAWVPSIRSRNNLRISVKRQFVDPSIAAAAMKMDENKLYSDLKTMGFFFESLCIRDLRIYSQPLAGTVYHYHDALDLEVDAIIELRDGRWGAVEIKMGVDEIPKAEDNLVRLKKLAIESRHNGPSFMMIIIATGYVSFTEKGILVVPIGCLKP